MERKIWTVTDVTDVFGPSAILRTYLEQRDVRAYLRRAAATVASTASAGNAAVTATSVGGAAGATAAPAAFACAVDVGCGYGRLTPVLGEFASRVIGCEREASLLDIARPLQPGVTFIETPSLAALPVESGAADVVLAFTVLQHMPDANAEAVLADIARIVRPGGHVLLCEETATTLEAGDAARADLGYTKGRAVEWYAERLSAFTLLDTSKRVIEPGYPRPDVGTYMFFKSDRASERASA